MKNFHEIMVLTVMNKFDIINRVGDYIKMYKSKKYTAVCILMIFIIALTVGVSAGFVEDKNVEQDSSQQQEDVTLPPDLVVDGEGQTGSNQTQTAPVFTNGYQAINYALNIIENGKGYTSFFSQTINTMGQTQKVSTKKYRSGNLDLVEEWYYIDFAVGENKYKCFYTDTDDMKIKTVTNKNHYSFDGYTYTPNVPGEMEEFAENYWTQTMGRKHLNSFFLTVDKTTSKLVYFDRSDKNNYVVKVQMLTDKIDDTYMNIIYANGASNVKINSLELTFYINKKTGYFTKILKKEEMNVTYAGFAAVDCKNTSTEIFSSMDTDCTQTINQKYKDNFEF